MKPGGRKNGESETYTTGEMARLSSNTLRTVRFYEEAGILQPIGRTEGGHRVFERAQLDKLMLVSDMREAGMSLEEIRTLLETKSRAASGGEAASSAVSALGKHIVDLRSKIEVLSRLADDLEKTVASAKLCVGCERNELFPSDCHSCVKLGDQTDLPRGMKVLWSINDKRKGAEAEPGSPNGRPGGGSPRT